MHHFDDQKFLRVAKHNVCFSFSRSPKSIALTFEVNFKFFFSGIYRPEYKGFFVKKKTKKT